MKKATLLLLIAFSFLMLLPGCLSESIKTKEECASLAPPASGTNWAGTEVSEYADAWAYEQVSCWHEAAVWYAIQGNTDDAIESCANIYSIDWDYESWLEEEHNTCISDIAEKLGDASVCEQILGSVESNEYPKQRCISRAQKAEDLKGREMCGGTAFILAGLAAFLFASPRLRK